MSSILPKFPLCTPAQIIRSNQIKKAVETGRPYKYMQKKKHYNPCRYALSGYKFSRPDTIKTFFRNLKFEISDFIKENFGD